MMSMAIVNNEQCVVEDNKHHVVVEVTHTTRGRQTQNTKGACCVTCVLAGLRAHYTTHANPQTKERREEKRRIGTRTKSSVGQVEALVSLTLRRATTQHNKQPTHKQKKRETR